MEHATNVLFIGPPGVGKTMLAVGLGHAAVAAGMRTYYTTAAELAARCQRAALEGRWATTMRFYAGPRLLIIDEVGYFAVAGGGGGGAIPGGDPALSEGQHRADHQPRHRQLGRVFNDDPMVAAMLDRLLDRSVVLNIDGDSYPDAQPPGPGRGQPAGGEQRFCACRVADYRPPGGRPGARRGSPE